MIERDFFERLNRFDERYEFAYYEDTDLCFSVRKAGKRVLYQPQSLLTHFEGISSGTDEVSGVKRYQAINRKNFFSKWHEQLATHLDNGQTPEIACDRQVLGHVLIVDACTPTPDQDSGSVDMFNLIRILIDCRYRVHFIPFTNFAHLGSYTQALQRMGVECIHAPHYSTLESYLAENGTLFDHVILSRLPVARQTIDQVRKSCARAQVIFYTVDLHFLREMREAELKNDVRLKSAAEQTRNLELAVMDKCDATIVLSETERDHLVKLGKQNIEVVPLIRESTNSSGVPFEKRSGVLFIGGYQHTPNVDAVDWLVRDVWPHVRMLAADGNVEPITLHLYGSKMPDHFNSYECQDIRVHGYVDDLAKAFAEVRLSVAPLRYGAGLKGKVASSWGYGVPVVGTQLAFEGMAADGLEEIRISADEPLNFARRIHDNYYDHMRWLAASAASQRYAQRNYSTQVAKLRIERILGSDRVEVINEENCIRSRTN